MQIKFNIIIVVALIIFAAFWNAKMDDCQFHNPDCRNDWKGKWQLNDKGSIISNDVAPWYYLKLYTPKYVEKFPFSSTALVAFTDKWHFYQFMFFNCFFLALVLFKKHAHWWSYILWFVGLRVVFGVSFEMFFK